MLIKRGVHARIDTEETIVSIFVRVSASAVEEGHVTLMGRVSVILVGRELPVTVRVRQHAMGTAPVIQMDRARAIFIG